MRSCGALERNPHIQQIGLPADQRECGAHARFAAPPPRFARSARSPRIRAEWPWAQPRPFRNPTAMLSGTPLPVPLGASHPGAGRRIRSADHAPAPGTLPQRLPRPLRSRRAHALRTRSRRAADRVRAGDEGRAHSPKGCLSARGIQASSSEKRRAPTTRATNGASRATSLGFLLARRRWGRRQVLRARSSSGAGNSPAGLHVSGRV